jgi:hypothetical protein
MGCFVHVGSVWIIYYDGGGIDSHEWDDAHLGENTQWLSYHRGGDAFAEDAKCDVTCG